MSDDQPIPAAPQREGNANNDAAHPNADTIPEMKIPPSHASYAVTCEKKRDKWDVAKLVVEFFGLGFLILYTLYTAGIYCANKKAADAAKESADIARDTLIASNRPWMTANIRVAGPFAFTEAGASVPILYKLVNVGPSPALRVWANVELYLPQNPERDAQAERSRLCSETIKSSIAAGQTVFPRTDIDGGITIAVSNEVVKHAVEFNKVGFLTPTIIACITYQSTIEKQDVWHTTGMIFDLWKTDNTGARFAIKAGEDVPLLHLRFSQSLWEATIAN